MTIAGDPKRLDDDKLLEQLRALVVRSNETEAELIEHLAEVDERRLYLPNHTSMFAFCTGELGFSEAAAENRIAVARAGRRLPRVIAMLRSGAIHLSGLRVLVPHLTDEGADALVDQARGKSKRAIEEIVACHAPRPAVPQSIRKVPERRVPESAVPPATPEPGPLFKPQPELTPPPKPAVVAPLAPDRYHVQLTASRELRDKIEQAKALLRHQVPNGDLATILDRALTVLIAKVKKERFGVGRKPRAGKLPEGPATSRHIPDAIKRAVYERDGGTCTFVGTDGKRCQEQGFIQFDHLDGFARREEHVASRIMLRCFRHNEYAAELMYGPELMARKRQQGRGQPVPGQLDGKGHGRSLPPRALACGRLGGGTEKRDPKVPPVPGAPGMGTEQEVKRELSPLGTLTEGTPHRRQGR